MYVAYAHVRPGTVANTNSPSGKTATTTGAATGTQADRGAELLSTLRKELGSAAGDDAKLAVYERISKQAEGLSEAQKREIFTTAFVSLSEQKQKDLSAFFGEVDRHERHKVELRAALAQEPSRAERELTLNHFNQFATSDEQRRELFTIFSESLSAPEQAELKTFFTEGERHERHKTELRTALQAQPDVGERLLTLNHFNQFATSDEQRAELRAIFTETSTAEERASLDAFFAALANPAPTVSYRSGGSGGGGGVGGGGGGEGEEEAAPAPPPYTGPSLEDLQRAAIAGIGITDAQRNSYYSADGAAAHFGFPAAREQSSVESGFAANELLAKYGLG